jgi:hypothetical protein
MNNFDLYRVLNLTDVIFLQTDYEKDGSVLMVYRVMQKSIETQFSIF